MPSFLKKEGPHFGYCVFRPSVHSIIFLHLSYFVRRAVDSCSTCNLRRMSLINVFPPISMQYSSTCVW